tara:strand:+ start:2065 stop:3195 length:1131 start_codon:yes stop_codon:yes gene_type:complete
METLFIFETKESIEQIFYFGIIALFISAVLCLRISVPFWKWRHNVTGKLNASNIALIIVGRDDLVGFENWIKETSVIDKDLEIIILDDQSQYETSIALEVLSEKNNLVNLVKTPENQKFWNSRKLAITLALKSTNRTKVVLVDTDCFVPKDPLRWLTQLTEPLNNGAIASFAPVNADLNQNATTRLYSAGVNLWAVIRAIRIFNYSSTRKITGLHSVNIAFYRSHFFDVNGFLSSMHVEDGEGEFLFNDISRFGEIVPVIDPLASILKNHKLKPQKDRKVHRHILEKLSIIIPILFLFLIDIMALIVFYNILFGKATIADLIKLKIILSGWVLIQFILIIFSFFWTKRYSASKDGIVAPFYLRWVFIHKIISLWKK